MNKEEIKQNGDRKTGCTTIRYKWAWDTKKAWVYGYEKGKARSK